jgi:hypothetical protein
MSKPSNNSAGTVVVPMSDFTFWVETTLLKPPTGTFVTWGKVKIKGTDLLEVQYTTSTEYQPVPPPVAAQQPVP